MTAARPASLPVVSPPLLDEALGSWLGRIATCYAISSRTLLVRFGIQHPRSPQNNWLTLAKLRSNDLAVLAKITRKSTATLASMGTSPWCLPDKAEFGMCPSCILESYAAGMPLYWRRFWVDAITVGCLKHSLWLVPIDTLAFLKSTNWLDVESQILNSARQAVGELNLRASSHFTRCISKGALHAQSLFNFGHDENAVLLRYGYVKVLEARQVANDLLDVLLTAESPTASSLLSAYVFLLNISLPSGAVSVPRRNGRVMCIRRVKTLDARIFALAMVDTLMAASCSTNTQTLPPEGVGAFAMRTHWLWTLMPQESLDLLMQRVKQWPAHYVRACWPELENLEHRPMLHRKKFLIKESVRLANRRLLGTSLANIRSH